MRWAKLCLPFFQDDRFNVTINSNVIKIVCRIILQNHEIMCAIHVEMRKILLPVDLEMGEKMFAIWSQDEQINVAIKAEVMKVVNRIDFQEQWFFIWRLMRHLISPISRFSKFQLKLCKITILPKAIYIVTSFLNVQKLLMALINSPISFEWHTISPRWKKN